MQIPDLLHADPEQPDLEALSDLLGHAFLGKDLETKLDEVLGASAESRQSWSPRLFSKGLFVKSVLENLTRPDAAGGKLPLHKSFLERVFAAPSVDRNEIRFRQDIFIELTANPRTRQCFDTLHQKLFGLLALFRAPSSGRHDEALFRLDIFAQVKDCVDWMVEGFSEAESGLKRLYETGLKIQASTEYKTIADLLDYEQNLGMATVRLRIGADGRIRDLIVLETKENKNNQFYSSPLRRLVGRLRLGLMGHGFAGRDLVSRLILAVYSLIEPAMLPLVHLLGQCDFYLAGLRFKTLSEGEGLDVCLPSFGRQDLFRVRDLFNPLLLIAGQRPVPSSVAFLEDRPTVLITGPNSGGKTRLLQALGLAQLFGQSGWYVPASSADMIVAQGLFVSILEEQKADETEGRFGQELGRIRSLFENLPLGSLILIDELCSGTNPSEAKEILSMVFSLFHRHKSAAFITTHFLDFVEQLQASNRIQGLHFLRVQLDGEDRPTFAFESGVAETSLAALTASRLGVTFEELSALVEAQSVKAPSESPSGLP